MPVQMNSLISWERGEERGSGGGVGIARDTYSIYTLLSGHTAYILQPVIRFLWHMYRCMLSVCVHVHPLGCLYQVSL